ncbi:MAG: DUF1839 family protein [Polyangiaceae bacterium]
MTRVRAIEGLEPEGYQPHALHAPDRAWVEKNCYIDIWIEVVHALGCEPMAMMPFALAIDFEGDQWTFFKPSHDELYELYGIDVQELNPWLSLLQHAETYLAAGKLVSSEADAFWLPDTSGTDYRRAHTKTTIVITDLDVEHQRLGYFHNAGYYALEGEDFIQTFRVGFPDDPTFMPFYVEAIRRDRLVVRPRDELTEMALASLKKQLRRRPVDNPVLRFGRQLPDDLARLHEQGLDTYHRWAFATLRQLGAAFESVALCLAWIDEGRAGAAFTDARAAFLQLSDQAKVFLLKAARAVNRKRALDVADDVQLMADAWQRGMDQLDHRVGGS